MKVTGSLSTLLNGINLDNFDYGKLIGAPINNQQGNTIGIIVNISIKDNIWYGEIDGDLIAIDPHPDSISMNTNIINRKEKSK